MRATSNEAHISGAERIVNYDQLAGMFTDLICRAIDSYELPDKIYITTDTIDADLITCARALDIKTIAPPSCKDARCVSQEIIRESGVPAKAIKRAFDLLDSGPTPEGKNMRGAIIMDAFTGERLEPDEIRGIRVSRVDYTEDTRMSLRERLKANGIYHERVMDALAIATKVSGREEAVAELCWSDNPDYTTGYVASKKQGYVRITNLKEKRSVRGGRIFFVKAAGLDLDGYINYLERQPVIINRAGNIN